MLTGITRGDSFDIANLKDGGGGWLVQPEIFSLSWASYQGRPVILLDSLLYRAANGKPVWRVLDAFRPPDSLASHHVNGICQMRGKVDENVFAYVRNEDTDTLRHLVQAWRVDTVARRFVAISLDGITCINEGYGG